MLYRWDWNCRKLQGNKSYELLISYMNVSHLLVWHGTQTYLIGTLSKHNQFQWGFGGRSTLLCSLHGLAVATSAWSAAPSQAGTPTVHKDNVNTSLCLCWRKTQIEKSKYIFTRRYCARATFWGILRYKPPVISQAWKKSTFWLGHMQTRTSQYQGCPGSWWYYYST